MCVQTITTEQDCLYLNYLDNCNPDRAYPPLRMYETNDFLIIDADDNKQISISKVGFEVDVNGITYTDIVEAQRQLAVEIKCVNESRTGDPSTTIDKISEQLEVGGPLTFIDLTNSQGTGWPGFPFDVNLIQWNDGTTTVGGAITATTVNDADELIALFNANIPNNQMQFRDATSVYLVAGTDPVPSAGYVNIQTTTPDALFYQQGFWGTDPDPVPSSPKVTAEKICNIVDGISTTPNIIPYTTYSTAGTIDTVVQILPANPNRSKVAVSILNGTALIVKGVPGGSVRRGVPVSSSGTWFDSVGNDGRMYRGIISVINTANGLDFDFSVTEE